MNKVILIGRLTKDPEHRSTASGTSVTSFTVAVDRRFKSGDGQRQADFIPCVAWRQTADFVSKYFSKGSRICVEGNIQTRTYDDANGQRRYVTEVVCDNVEFVESKAQNSGGGAQRNDYNTPQEAPSADDMFAEDLSDFQPLDDAELPF